MGLDQHERRPLLMPLGHQEQCIQAQDRQPEDRFLRAPDGQVGLDRGDAGRFAGRQSGEHGRVKVNGRDLVARFREGPDNPAAAGRQLEDRAARPLGEGQVQADVIAGILGQVEVIQAGKRSGLGAGWIVPGAHALGGCQRTVAPARFLTASALIASRAARLAAIAVVSAWS